ncbi:MAG: metallophosphoesterase family protein, partial [Terriglobales bacterium]
DFLTHAVFNRLVLLGDIFCDLNFRRLKAHHWEFLSLIRKLSNPKRGVEVVWVEGNHDKGLTDVMSHLVGVEVYQEYSWRYNGRHYLAVHGHQFDRFLVNCAPISALGEYLYLQIQKIDFKNGPIAHVLDSLNSRWLRLTPKVADGALALARSKAADVVFCGHTHQAFECESEGVRYVNIGCWIHDRLTYAAIDASGVKLAGFPRISDENDMRNGGKKLHGAEALRSAS